MLYRIYEFAHGVGIHFWDIPSILVLILIAVVGISHTLRQKKREEEFEEEMAKRRKEEKAMELRAREVRDGVYR